QASSGFNPGGLSFSPDGLWLATGASNGRIAVWEPLTGKRVWNEGGHQAAVYTLSFGRDVRTLMSGGGDGLGYVWNLRPAGRRPDNNPARLWDDLAGDDALAAYQALWSLSEMPDRCVTILAEKLRPVKTVFDLDRVADGTEPAEHQRLRRMKAQL